MFFLYSISDRKYFMSQLKKKRLILLFWHNWTSVHGSVISEELKLMITLFP